MYGRDFIQVFDQVAPPTLCNVLIDHHRTQQGLGNTYLGPTSGGLNPRVKCSEDLNLEDGLAERDLVKNLFCEVRNRYLSQWLHRSPLLQCEARPPWLIRYPQGVGFMRRHVDSYATSVVRELTTLLYLNTVEEGGETVFPSQGIAVKPVQGRVVVFPSFWMFPHSSETPLTGDKYIAMTVHTVEEFPC